LSTAQLPFERGEGARDPAETVEVLNLILTFFGDGERWVKGRLSDRRGNRCLVGALDFATKSRCLGPRQLPML